MNVVVKWWLEFVGIQGARKVANPPNLILARRPPSIGFR